jgi:hypothetical protein
MQRKRWLSWLRFLRLENPLPLRRRDDGVPNALPDMIFP